MICVVSSIAGFKKKIPNTRLPWTYKAIKDYIVWHFESCAFYNTKLFFEPDDKYENVFILMVYYLFICKMLPNTKQVIDNRREIKKLDLRHITL